MNIRESRLWVPCVIAAALVVIPAVVRRSASSPLPQERKPAAPFPCEGFPRLVPDLPGDASLPSHATVQCFAWQELVALNWPALRGRRGEPDRSRPAADFGKPGDPSPLVWETFKDAHEVFLPEGREPKPWNLSGMRESLPASLKGVGLLPEATQFPDHLVLRMQSVVSPLAPRLRDFTQAGGGWLTAQNRKLTYYAIHMNRAAFEYVRNEKLYDARNQAGQAIDFPSGDEKGAGAIVLKSAWVEITDPALFPRFRMAKALIVENGGIREADVGLVGLHIVHKTKSFPQWTWATFEHVDNAPDREEVRQGTLRSSYTYFNPSCPTCEPNRKPEPTDPKDRPIQVVRLTPLPDGVKTLNREVYDLIRKANPASVWQYYQLVEVQWPQAPSFGHGTREVPLPAGGPFPTSVANSTLETYMQPRYCLQCHRNARIACSSRDLKPKQNADYIFLLTLAKQPNPPKECSR